MKQGWATVALAEVTKRISNWHPKTESGVFEYIDLSSVDQVRKVIKCSTTTPCDSAPSRARQLVATGDVLVSTVRPNLNGVAMVPDKFNGATASTGFTVLRPTHLLHSNYLFHWVKGRTFIQAMVRQATGASYPAVSDKVVKGSEIPLPSLDEQRRIAAILDHVDTLRELRRDSSGKMHALEGALLDRMASCAGASTLRLDELIDADDRINYGVVQPGSNTVNGVPLIRISDLRNDRVDRSSIKLIDPTVESNYRRSRIRGTEILVGCVGTIGAVAITSPEDIGSNVARAVSRVPISDPVLRRYVASYLRSDGPQRYFRKEVRAVAQPTLNIKQLAATIVPVPPRAAQREFVAQVEHVDALRSATERHLADLDMLFASLQSRAFAGELDVSKVSPLP